MQEELLPNNYLRPIVRIEDTIRRPVEYRRGTRPSLFAIQRMALRLES